MSDLEQKIRALLDEEDRKFDSDRDDDPPFPSIAMSASRNLTMQFVRRYTFWWHVVSIVFLVVGLFSALSMGAPNYFMCGIYVIMVTISLCVMKLWYWICFARFSISKEIKRLELQIADLAKKLEQSKEPAQSDAGA